MNDKDTIFSAIRGALNTLPERAAYPEWDDNLPVCKAHPTFACLKDLFASKLAFASARYMDSTDALRELLISEESTFGYCDPALAERFSQMEGITFDTEYDESKIDEYRFGITRASGGIAESGTIVLKDADTSARLAALAPWIHIAVIEESTIVESIPEAIQKFGDDPSIIFVTGPSKTADVEGILIEGVHGPGIQIGFVLP